MIELIIFILLCVGGTGMVGRNAYIRTNYGIGPSKRRKLSEPSKRILSKYYDLPKDARAIEGLPDMLAALDFKYEADEVTRHFETYRRRYDGSSREFTWDCGCYRGCSYQEYSDIHKGIKRVAQALEEKEKAVQLVNRAGVLENASSVAERLNDEATAITKSVEGLK